MYLAKLRISNFRRLAEITLEFQPGLNIIVGPNNIGKSAVVDALRSLLAGADDPYPRFTRDDIHVPIGADPAGEITFTFTFRDLSGDEEADFLHALRPDATGKFEAILGVTYGDQDKAGRLRSRKWCGEHESLSVSSGMLDNLRSVYLQPLRDAEFGLRPSRNSQLARLLHLLTEEGEKENIREHLSKIDKELKELKPILATQTAIAGRHKAMLGPQLHQVLSIDLSGNDFTKLAARLSVLINSFDIERNGLGYNNLIFMAVVLSELARNADAAYRSLIVEEPEAHLHPQLQAVLLKYLSGIESAAGEKPVQVFVTSHSPNFASIADLGSVVCMVETEKGVESFHPRDVKFLKGRREKLKRYLDVTRAEFFFARRIIFVEGAAELLMVSTLAKRLGYDLREHGVSLISVEGLNFDSFLPLFGAKAIRIPVAILTDADPKIADTSGKLVAHYPAAGEAITVSDNTALMLKSADAHIGIFHGQKTFEYDLGLIAKNRTVMLDALKELHPHIGADLEAEVAAQGDDAAKAKCLFQGMFERDSGNVKKGRFAQALADLCATDETDFEVPDYIRLAVEHVCA